MGQLYSHLVFRPPTPTYDSYDGRMLYVTPDKAGVPCVCSAALVWLRNDLGAHIPAAWVTKPKSQYVILFAHSNGDDLGNAMIEAQRISDALDISVLAFDYTGYGISELPKRPRRRPRPASNPPHPVHTPHPPVQPSLTEEDRRRAQPSEVACYADIACAYEYLVADCRIEPANIILVGRSIGSGPVVHCAASYPVGGVVLVAPIASAVRVALKRFNVTLPLIDTFANIDKVDKIRCPVLIVHGHHDELVPMRHAELLVEKARKFGTAVEPLWIPHARHNNVVEDNQSLVFGRYKNFLQEVQSCRDSIGALPRCSTSRDLGLGYMLRFLLDLPARAVSPARAKKLCCDKGRARAQRQPEVQQPVTEPVSADLSGPVGCLRRKRRRSGAPSPAPAADAPARKLGLTAKERSVFSAGSGELSELTGPDGSLSSQSTTDEFDSHVLDEELCRALLRSPSASQEFMSYPVDGNDRISLSYREGLGSMLAAGKRQPAEQPKIAKCQLPPLTDSVIQAMQMSAEWI